MRNGDDWRDAPWIWTLDSKIDGIEFKKSKAKINQARENTGVSDIYRMIGMKICQMISITPSR
jgi:hypothetical protein